MNKVVYKGLEQRSYTPLGPVTTWMGDCSRAGKPSGCVTSHDDDDRKAEST